MPIAMSVYRQGQARVVWDSYVTAQASSSETDEQLIALSVETGKPVLVSMDKRDHAVVKPVGEDDDALSFESLYDDCYTVTDLLRMQAAKVKDPADIPPMAYRVEVGFPIEFVAGMAIALFAKSPGDVRPALRQLLLEDDEFRGQIYARIAATVAVYLINSEDLTYVIRDTTSHEYRPIEPPLDPKGEQKWRILPD